MSEQDLLLRTATLFDETYRIVKEVVVPKGIEWPSAIRYEGRVFLIYHRTIPATIDAVKLAEQNYPYREVQVWDATV
jgi:hypothetical protein